MGRLRRFIESRIPGVYVHSVMVGANPTLDTLHGYFGDVNAQVAEQCATLLAEPRLARGFYALGFSQGSQFIRALTQRCGGGAVPGDGRLIVKRLVTMGGQHAGVSDVPRCDAFESSDAGSAACRAAEAFVRAAAYAPFARSNVVQAQYFRDPGRVSAYLASNPFLPDVNNELAEKKASYRANLLALERLVLIRFANDTIVVPRDSAWFGAYADGATPGGGGRVVEMRDSRAYAEDWIGLKTLDESGRLVMFDCPGEHMHFADEWFEEHVIDPHLRDDAPPSAPGELRLVETLRR